MNRLTGIGIAALLCVACGSETSTSTSGGAGGAGGTGGRAGAGGAGGTAGQATGGSGGSAPAKRTVEVRSPWGTMNGDLVLDGDFELSVQTSTWFDDQGVSLTSFASGGRCRSGILCAKLGANSTLSTSPLLTGDGLKAAFHAKIEGACSGVTGSVIAVSLSTNSQDVFDIRAVSDVPEADGWCLYEGHVSVQKTYDAALFSIETTAEALIDEVSLFRIIVTSRSARAPSRSEAFKPWKRPSVEPPKLRALPRSAY